MAAYEVLLLNTAIPQIQAAQSGDTYVVPRDIAFSAALTLSAGTANGVPYLNGSKVVTTGSALTFDGTTLTSANISVTSQLTVKTLTSAVSAAFMVPWIGDTSAGGSGGVYTTTNFTFNPSTGDFKIPGNFVVGTSGKGIDFSVTSEGTGTMTSELLDDYEEGTWTPLISDGTNNATNIPQTGASYTKVGRLVTLTGTIGTSSLGSVTGDIRLTGFPFATPTQFYAQSAGVVSGTSGLNITAGQSVSLLLDRTSAFAYIQISDAATGNSMMTATQWSADGAMTFSISYVVE